MAQPNRQDDTYENAVQHCYASCMATIHFDFSTAKAFGDAHECNEDTDASRRDLNNNAVGRNIGYNLGFGGTDEKCLTRCQKSADLRWHP